MNNNFGEACGLAVIILALSFGCSHCNRTKLENDKLRLEIKQMEKAAKSAQVIDAPAPQG
jgi:hypothetical protein